MAAGAKQIPIAAGLFTWPSDDPHLIGTKDKSTGRYVFPVASRYGQEDSDRYEDVLLANRGTLWAYTVQRFLPKSPPYDGPETLETFKPFAVGYVELPGQLKVEARLTGCAPEELRIGMDMKLVVEKFKEDDQGNEIMAFAFAPA